MNLSNCTIIGPTHGTTKSEENSWDDATWILTSSFIIFTMQSGFGLLESGTVTRKNEVNIMVKNASDVVFGGLSYWLFGYAFIFGEGEWSNAFCGFGEFATDATDQDQMGWTYARFVFQASFATTATTIVSGAMAERTKLNAYCVFSFLNTLVYCFPAHWVWAHNGFLFKIGVVDIAGAGVVHLVGGISGLVATIMLKPRRKRFDGTGPPQMNNPTNALLGMFMLWWGWLGFNCGSTFGISNGKWMLATRAAVTTIMASIGGGLITILLSYFTLRRKFSISYIINGVLGGLVSSTALCAIARPWECFIIGMIGGIVAVYTNPILEKLQIDDPVGAVGVHATAAVWSLISVGIFGQPDDIQLFNLRTGLVYGGDFTLLGVQLLTAFVIIIWTTVITIILILLVDVSIGLRCSEENEILGADFIEHGITQNLCELNKELNTEEFRAFMNKYLAKEDAEVPEILQLMFDTISPKRKEYRNGNNCNDVSQEAREHCLPDTTDISDMYANGAYVNGACTSGETIEFYI